MSRGTARVAVARYVIFVALLSLVPVAFDYFARFASIASMANSPVARGDVFIISATVAFAGAGEVLGRTRIRSQTLALIAAGLNMINGVLAALMYAAVSAGGHHAKLQLAVLEWSQLAFAIAAGVTAVFIANRNND